MDRQAVDVLAQRKLLRCSLTADVSVLPKVSFGGAEVVISVSVAISETLRFDRSGSVLALTARFSALAARCAHLLISRPVAM